MKSILITFVALLTLLLYPASATTALDVSIVDNGSGSSNEVSVVTENTVNVEQTNTVSVENIIEASSNIGENTASENSGDMIVDTGDSSQVVVVENALNESFVETDDCCNEETTVVIGDNGADSANSVIVNENINTNVVISQNATTVNNISGSANTGNNTANQNSGRVEIVTGDISVAGRVVNGPINLHSVSLGASRGSVNVFVLGNSADSVNNAVLTRNISNNVFVFNKANILNNTTWDLNTGNNEADGNSGFVHIDTGDMFFEFFVEDGLVNFGTIDIGGCCIVTDPSDPVDLGDPIDPSDPLDPGRGGGSGLYGTSSEVQAAVYSTATDVVEILGLSATSTGSFSTNPFAFWVGISLMAAGLKLITEARFNKA